MPRLAFFFPVLALSVVLAACSKKKEEAAASQPESSAAAEGTAAASEEAPKEFDFSGKTQADGPGVSVGGPESVKEPGSETIEVQVPSPIRYYPAFYPLSLRMQGIEGRIDVGMIVDEQGRVEEAVAVTSTEPRFTEYALESARHCLFTPALHEGKPLRWPIKIPISFLSEYGSGGMMPGSPLANLAYVDGKYFDISEDGSYALANRTITPLMRVTPDIRLPDGLAEARVQMRFKVSEEGRVMAPEIVTSSGSLEVDALAIEAITFWQFIPRIKDGVPVVATASLPLVITAPKQ